MRARSKSMRGRRESRCWIELSVGRVGEVSCARIGVGHGVRRRTLMRLHRTLCITRVKRCGWTGKASLLSHTVDETTVDPGDR